MTSTDAFDGVDVAEAIRKGVYDAIWESLPANFPTAVLEAIATGVEQAMTPLDVNESIANGIDRALEVYPSQVLDAISTGTEVAIREVRGRK